MNTLELVAVVLLLVWLGLLTIVTVLIVRQVALLSVRLSIPVNAFSLADDGPELGSEVPAELQAALNNGTQLHHLLILSANCAPCRELAAALAGRTAAASITALITGPAELARAIEDLLPAGVDAVGDPEAAKLIGSLGIESRPFAVTVEGATITRKIYVRGRDDLLAFVAAGHEAAAAPEEVAHVG